MPISPKRPCFGKGPRRGKCTNTVSKGTICCDDCVPFLKQQTREYDIERDQSEGRQFLHSTRWRKIRGMKLSIDPICEECARMGRTKSAILVHHIDRDETNCEGDNLRSLCTECHEREHRNERWGRAG